MKDNLDRKIYAQKIADEISEHYDYEKKEVSEGKKKECENIVFAISGKWGEGKTGLLSLLEDPLVKKGFKIIRFNPWKYSQEDITLKRAFLRSVKDQLSSDVTLDDLYFDRTKTIINLSLESIVLGTLVGSFIWFVLLPVLLGMSIYNWLSISNNYFLNISSLMKIVITLLLIPIILQIITISRRSANVSTAEEFEEKFKELLEGKEKLVIFVDDLDRCNPKTVKVVLDSLRTFFQHPECSYIITGDHTVVERYAGDELELPEGTTPQQKLQEGRRFLKKLFDVYWRLPLPTPFQFGFFVDEEIKSSKINLSDPQQSSNLKSFLVDNDLFERNPRHIKRFITKLRFALEGVDLQKQELAKKEDKKLKDTKESLDAILSNSDLLAKVLLFEEFFYPVYEKLILNPEELINHEKDLRNGKSPNELKIKNKLVLELLDSKQEDLEKYIALVKKAPKFTDENNSTLHEVANYFSFSGSTGLPSVLGPDETNFEQYLKAGQLDDKLGAVLGVAKKNKKSAFAKKALEAFDQANDTEKVNIVGEGIKLSRKLDEWAENLDQWKQKLFILPEDKQNALARDFWTTVLEKKPDLIGTIKKEKITYIDHLWELIESVDKPVFSNNAISEIEKFLSEAILPQVLNLKCVEIYLKKVASANLKGEIEKHLDSPETCKVYLDHLHNIGFPDGKVAIIVKDKIKIFLEKFQNFEWIIVNKDYLKNLGLLESVEGNIRKWSGDSKQLLKIADHKDALELTDGIKSEIANNAVNLINKSADLQFIENANIQSFLNKEDKKEILDKFKNILADADESLEKRKKTAQLLLKNNSVWNEIETNDVYETLKKIKKIKLEKVSELKDKQKEILDSWGYNDKATEKEKSEEKK